MVEYTRGLCFRREWRLLFFGPAQRRTARRIQPTRHCGGESGIGVPLLPVTS